MWTRSCRSCSRCCRRRSTALKSVQTTMLLTTHSTMSGIFEQTEELGGYASCHGQDFDAAKNDDSFYLPRERVRQSGFPTSHEAFPFTGREGGALHHYA